MNSYGGLYVNMVRFFRIYLAVSIICREERSRNRPVFVFPSTVIKERWHCCLTYPLLSYFDPSYFDFRQADFKVTC